MLAARAACRFESNPGFRPASAPVRIPHNTSMRPTLVLVAHPQMHLSRVNAALMKAAAGLGDEVVVRDLYAAYPDYLIDTAAEQQALREAELVVWVHPIRWYGMPPMMKLWLDEVLTAGWAYGAQGHALHGKSLWLVASTDGPRTAYQPDASGRPVFDLFLPPYEQTATVCGMRFLPPLVLRGAHRVTAAELQDHVDTFVQRLRSYPDWPELA
jgi:glutathione-regulated potassium-efflux system ancillary protein KefF